jgi:hypothetical protein
VIWAVGFMWQTLLEAVVNEEVCEKYFVVVYIVFMDHKRRQKFDSNHGTRCYNEVFSVFSNGSVHISSLMWKM